MYLLFREKVGHTICSEIHKIRYGRVYRLFVPEESEAFHNMGGHSRKDALRFVALRPGLLRISFLMLKENPNLEAGQSYRCSED